MYTLAVYTYGIHMACVVSKSRGYSTTFIQMYVRAYICTFVLYDVAVHDMYVRMYRYAFLRPVYTGTANIFEGVSMS